MAIETIECMYTCSGCGLKKTKVQVASRSTGQDLMHWFDKVLRPAIARDHFNKSPHCKTDIIQDLYIPINKEDESPLGAPVKPPKPQ